MNNGKVRIYELSRELNLDNKDILAVCEQLNISVKSHSSTITEAEAERIRTYAEKHPASTAPVKRSGNIPAPSASAKHKTSGQNLESAPKPSGPKPQQILEVRTHAPRTNSPKPPVSDNEATPPVLVPPSSSVQKRNTASGQQAQSSMKPTMLNRPMRPNNSEATASIDDASTDLATEVDETDPQPFVEQPEPKPEITATAPPKGQPPQRSPQTVGPKVSEAPRLTAPPARPSEPSSAIGMPTSAVNRPVLKRAKTEGVAEVSNKPNNRDRQETALEAPREQVARINAPTPPQRPEAPALTPPKEKPQLVRPKARTSESESRSDSTPTKRDRTGTTTAVTETEELTLNRPTPPRPPKKAKKRGDEDEEMQDFPEKVGKVGVKAKRRVKTIDEDDEDFDLDLDESDAPVQVSLSVARPAKPVALQRVIKNSTTGSTAAAPKAKKTVASRDGSSKAARRERREQQTKERPEKLVLTGSLTVRELADALGVAETEVVKQLFFKGMAVNITQTLDIPTATLVAQELGVEVETAEAESEARKVTEMIDAEDLENLQRRPPVVTIMGHVDHGKTTLLDAIRKTKVAQGEAGGITQHIGAYHVDVEHLGQMQQIVFLDTPGHEAFTAMRARGARVTDIAVLVVAADDGVQPQTVEAISHAKAAEVPIVVAINKIDKVEAQADRVKQELTEYALVPEEWGGDTIMVPVSAIKGENLDGLLEMLLLVAEVGELSANPNRPAKGTVIEANLDKARGPVATLLVQNGTLRVGDVIVAGSAMGKVRAMIDDRGDRVSAASPSFAVEVLGLNEVPAAGDEFEVFLDEKAARALAEERGEAQRQSRLMQAMASRRVSLSTLSAQAQEGQLKELNLILKADVQGSVEAILGALRQLPQNEVQVRVLFAAPGEISETDVDLAAASNAVIIGFNTTLATGARSSADQAGVDVREYNIIYKLLDDIQAAMEGLLEPELVEEPLGQVEVRAVYSISKGAVAGCYVLSGKVIRNSKVRVRRGGNVIHEGILDSLRRMKEDVREVNAGYECGISLDNFHAWAEGDIIEVFRMVTKRRTLSAS